MDNCAHEVVTVPDQVEQKAPLPAASGVPSSVRGFAGHRGAGGGCAPGGQKQSGEAAWRAG